MENMTDEEQVIRPGRDNNGAGQSLTKVGFGTTEVTQQRETQGMALAARAQAEVQARYIVALQRPRNLEQVRVRILDHCKRRGFANVAEYEKPVGGQKIRGPSIRFVETALLEYGNNLPEATIVYDDDYRRIVRVSVTDLERNVTYYDDATVEKFVERKNPKNSDEVIGSRTNSQNQQVYRIRATEDDFANKVGAAVSKKTRNLGLRIIPADITDEAMSVCKKTRETADAQDPAAARRQIIDSFAQLRVMPTDLEAYLGHPVDQASPAEMEELRAAFSSVREGEAKWIELVEVQRARRGEVEKPTEAIKAVGDKLKNRIDDARAKAAAKAGKTPATGTAAATSPAASGEPTEEEKREIKEREAKEQGR